MDRVVVDRALRALAEIGAVRTPKAQAPRVVPVQFNSHRPAEVFAQSPGEVELEMTEGTQPKPDRLAPCGSPHCAGCYDVGDGKKIHPPKASAEWLAWLVRWKPEGKLQ